MGVFTLCLWVWYFLLFFCSSPEKTSFYRFLKYETISFFCLLPFVLLTVEILSTGILPRYFFKDKIYKMKFYIIYNNVGRFHLSFFISPTLELFQIDVDRDIQASISHLKKHFKIFSIRLQRWQAFIGSFL